MLDDRVFGNLSRRRELSPKVQGRFTNTWATMGHLPTLTVGFLGVQCFGALRCHTVCKTFFNCSLSAGLQEPSFALSVISWFTKVQHGYGIPGWAVVRLNYATTHRQVMLLSRTARSELNSSLRRSSR